MKRGAGGGHRQHVKQLLTRQLWLWQHGWAWQRAGDEPPWRQLHLWHDIKAICSTSDCTLLLGLVSPQRGVVLGYGCDYPVGKELTGMAC